MIFPQGDQTQLIKHSIFELSLMFSDMLNVPALKLGTYCTYNTIYITESQTQQNTHCILSLQDSLYFIDFIVHYQ